MSFDEWVALDLKYIQERSFWVDWKIIFLTVDVYKRQVRYDPKSPSPDRWLTFLHELLDDADIPTLQEYLGYCLIPLSLIHICLSLAKCA